MNMNKDFQPLFAKQKRMIQKAVKKLDEIFTKITVATESPFSKEENFEILTSRFARLADLYTQKLLALLFSVLQEPDMSFIDKCEYLEKLELTPKAQNLYEIRKLRNQIAHDYALEELEQIYEMVFTTTPILISFVENTVQYLEQLLTKIKIT